MLFLTVVGCATPPADSQHPAASAEPPLVLPIGQTEARNTPFRLAGPLTVGGTDGSVIRVTTLAATGPGSLDAALDARGPRLIVFDVGGVIDLAGRSLAIRSPYATVAGQTAPDPGITIIRGELTVTTHDVVIQHIAVRPGDGGSPPPRPGSAPDGINVHRSTAGPVHHVLIENCSATWAIDENISVSGPADVDTSDGGDATAHDVVLRHCLIAEGLSHAGHPKGEHSKGTLIHDGVRNAAIVGCVYASNRERNPRLKGGTTAVVAGNVVYDWSSACVGVGAQGNRRLLAGAEAVVANNLAIGGPDTHRRVLVHAVDPGARVWLGDNLAFDASGKELPLVDAGIERLTALPSWAPPIDRGDVRSAVSEALRRAGSRPARRDPIDARIIGSVIRGDGRIIDSQETVGGYPIRAETHRVLDVPAGAEDRSRWLASLSAALEEDRELDLEPLWKRLRR